MLLVETAEKITDIDQDRSEKALKRAEDRLKDATSNINRAKAAINRSRNRLKIIKRVNS